MAEESTGSVASKESKLLYWEVYNFMCLTHAKIEFDESGIINIIGYNDSGKSASLRALEVNMYNRYPQSQLSFIQSGKDYFRVMSVWSDGIVIIKDKYLNGQGLYEMWKGDKCLYSTKQNGVLTKIAEVPACIQEYLNLVKFEDSYLNSRSCFEKQFLVQTTGSENYTSLNTVLRSEELSLAGGLINADRNKLASDISVADTELSVLRTQYKEGAEITQEFIDALKEKDKLLDLCEEKLSSLGSLEETSKKVAEIVDIPEIKRVSEDQMLMVDSIINASSQLSGIPDIPLLTSIEVAKIDLMHSIIDADAQLSGIPDVPPISSVSEETLTDMAMIIKSIKDYNINEEDIKRVEAQLVNLSEESKDIEVRIKDFGVSTVRCKNCGALVEVGGDGSVEQCCSGE